MSSSRSRKLWAKHLSGQGKKSPESNHKTLLRKTPYEGRILGIDPSLRGTGLLFSNAMARAKGFAFGNP